MIRKSFLLLLLVSVISFAQNSKTPRIGVIDMEYILGNIPEYVEAQAKLTTKANNWQQEVENTQKEVVELQRKLDNERILLTHELVLEKEDFIKLKEIDVKNLQNKYFGTKGDYYKLRQVLVKPIQDEVYNAIREIAKKRGYDMVLDKSSELIFLYINDKYDISELVLKTIIRTKKIRKGKASDVKNNDREIVPTEKQEKLNVKNQKREKAKQERFKQSEEEKKARKKLIEERKAAYKKKMEERKKAIENKRLKRLKELEERKKQKTTKK